MNRPLGRFWCTLEVLPDLSAVASEWRSLLQAEYEWVEPFLLPTPRLAGSVKSTVPGRWCVHEIRHFKGQYLAVCPDGCETVTLPREELVVRRLDVHALCRQIAEAMGLKPCPPEPLPYLPKVLHVGALVPCAGRRFEAWLAMLAEPDDLCRAVDVLSAGGKPFILLSATPRSLTQACLDRVGRTRSCFIALVETLGLDDRGRLALLDGRTAGELFSEFRAAHLPQPKADDGMIFFPTPAAARWEDVSIRFIDRHSVYIDVRGVTGKYHCTQMGMASRKNAKPTVQWLLLEAFAEGHGRIDWRNRKADRKNQKRKENLAADLRRFFRIDGDPFALEGDGWRARFAVAIND